MKPGSLSLYTTKVLEDPCLVHFRWLDISTTPSATEEQFLDKISTILFECTQLAHKQNLSQICITVPISWNRLREQLVSKGLIQSLLTLQWRRNTASFSDMSSTTNLEILTSKPEPKEIVPLLEQQATFHAAEYPEYYADVLVLRDRNFFEYYSSIVSDESIKTLTLYEKKILVGYLEAQLHSDEEITITELIIAESHRGRGLGTHLLSSFLLSPKFTEKNIYVQTWYNQLAKNVYQKVGFHHLLQEYYFVI